MSRHTPIQEMHLRNVRTARNAYLVASKDSLARAREIAAREVLTFQAAMDHEVRLAFEAGVKKTPLREIGMGTKAPKTLEDSLARTAKAAVVVVEKIETDPFAARYAWDEANEQLIVTLAGLDLELAATAQDWTAESATEAEVNFAEFEIDHTPAGDPILSPLEDDYLPGYGKRHPIVVWAQDADNEAEALAWVRDKLRAMVA